MLNAISRNRSSCIPNTPWRGTNWERDLSKSVQLYPKYAVAWYELGRTYQQQKKLDEANHAHLEAIKIDSKFVSPYGELATMAAVQQKWGDVDQYTSQMLKLNPYVVPEIYFYSAVANYNLQKLDLAERRAREAAKAPSPITICRSWILPSGAQEKRRRQTRSTGFRASITFWERFWRTSTITRAPRKVFKFI